MNKSAVQERPWTDYEKVALLAEIIKQAHVTPGALLKLIVELDVHPRWEDIPLPEGRSLNSSRTAFEEMHKYRTHYQQLPSHYTQPGPLLSGPPPLMSRKRPLAGSELTPTFPALQPKPPNLSPALYQNSQMEGQGMFRHSGESSEPPRKRRGRPSNAQIEEEKAAALAEGRIWQPRPPRAPRKKKPKTEGETSPTTEAVTAQASVPQTPEIQMRDAEESSSGKKRRRRGWDDRSATRPPYDPVRQATPEVVSTKAEISPLLQEQTGQASYHFHATPDPDSGNASSTPKDV